MIFCSYLKLISSKTAMGEICVSAVIASKTSVREIQSSAVISSKTVMRKIRAYAVISEKDIDERDVNICSYFKYIYLK